MSMRTPFTDLVGVRHPIALAPMGGAAGGALAAEVSNGGGLGLVGGARGALDWLDRELTLVTGRTSRPWGVGFLTWAVGAAAIERALSYRPAAVMLSFGDPAPFAPRVLAAGVPLIVQVTDLDEARRALDAGADVIVAQGAEAGGHGGGRATLPFVPAVVDLAAPRPVLAAGGIADGRGLAAVLALGAAGAMIGTRFQASQEALIPAVVGKALVEAAGEDTERGRVHDVARASGWPHRYTARTLRNEFGDRWRGREDELRRDRAAQEEFLAGTARGDLDVMPVWAGESLDLITDLPPATDIVARLAADAEAAIARVARAGVPDRAH
jgi:nitronate monooxygenase